MALVVELWVGGWPAGGVEDWWDDIELALAVDPERYPLLRAVDPYGDAVVSAAGIAAFRAELGALRAAATGRTREQVTRLVGLCDEALAAGDAAELRFRGD